MTRKATPFARHPLPSPGSPVCVRLLCQAAARGGGQAGRLCRAPRPFPSSGWGEAYGVFLLQEKFAPALLERGQGGSMAAWEERSPRAPGPISPQARSHPTSSLIPPELVTCNWEPATSPSTLARPHCGHHHREAMPAAWHLQGTWLCPGDLRSAQTWFLLSRLLHHPTRARSCLQPEHQHQPRQSGWAFKQM